MPTLDVTQEELVLIKHLIQTEEAETRVEIHHARANFQYHDALKARLKDIHDLQAKIGNLAPDEA